MVRWLRVQWWAVRPPSVGDSQWMLFHREKKPSIIMHASADVSNMCVPDPKRARTGNLEQQYGGDTTKWVMQVGRNLSVQGSRTSLVVRGGVARFTL